MDDWYRCKECGQILDDTGGSEYPTIMEHLLDYHLNISGYVESIDGPPEDGDK